MRSRNKPKAPVGNFQPCNAHFDPADRSSEGAGLGGSRGEDLPLAPAAQVSSQVSVGERGAPPPHGIVPRPPASTD